MKKFSSQGLVALGVVAALGLGTPALAYAGTSPSGETQSKTLQHQSSTQHFESYREKRQAIEYAFHSAVKAAQSAYSLAIAEATSSAQRNTALQIMESTINQAVTTRSAALTALGPPPEKTTDIPTPQRLAPHKS
jgi:hypothetical protein